MVIKDKQSECGQPHHRFQMSQFWSVYTETQPWSFQTKTGSAAFSKVSIFEGQKFWSSVNNWHNAPFTRGVQRLSFTLNGVTLSIAELNCGSVTSLQWRCSQQKLKTFQVPTQSSANQIALCKYPSAEASQSHSYNTRNVCDWLLSL